LKHRNSLPDSGNNNLNSRPELLSAPKAEFLSITEAARADSTPNRPSMSGMVDSILEVGRQRATLLAQLRAALESGQEKDALALARRLCGLSL
jgi:hypothetical protein